MPKFHIKHVDDLFSADYIKRTKLIKDEILFNQPKLKFIGHTYEYFKLYNILKICGILENGLPANLSISKIPLRLYVVNDKIKYKILSSRDYEKYYLIDEFFKEVVTNTMCLNHGINLRELYPDEYQEYIDNYHNLGGGDFCRHFDLLKYFNTYDSKINFISKNMKQYLRFNANISEDFVEEDTDKFRTEPMFMKLLERGYEYYPMHLVYEINFDSVKGMEAFYKKYENNKNYTIMGYKKGKTDKYILSTLSKLDIPINFWVYLTNFSYSFENNEQVHFRINVNDIHKITDVNEIPTNTNSFQVAFDYETYHGGDQSLIISDYTEFCSVSFVYSWLNKPEYGEIFIMNSDKDFISNDDSYTYLCDNEYLSLLCMIRVLYYLQPDYLLAFNAIDFDHLVTMILLRRYNLLVYYMKVLNRIYPVNIDDYEVLNDIEYLKDPKNKFSQYEISCNYKLDLKDKYAQYIGSISDCPLINNNYSKGETIKDEGGKSLIFSMVNIPGIIFLDIFLISKLKYKKEAFISSSASLDSILKINGFNTKVQLSYYMMWKIYEYLKDKYRYDNASDANTLEDIKTNIGMYMDKWREYNNYDSIACKLILDKFKYIDQKVYEANSTYVDMYKSCYRAMSSKVENLFSGVYYRSRYLIDENTIMSIYGPNIAVEGAKVDLVKTGLIKKAIQPIDVQSLYPSIMICLNLSYDTMQVNDKEIDYILETEGLKEEDIVLDIFEDINNINIHIGKLKDIINSRDPEVILSKIKSMIKYQDNKYSIIKFNFQSDPSMAPPRRMLLVNEWVTKGIIPIIETGYFDARVVIKKQLSTFKETDVDYKIIDARQNAIKTIMNTIYGLLNTKTFVLKNEGLASNVTLMGRHIILCVKYFCIDILDLLVVYLDTDSNYLAFKPEVFREQKLAYKSGLMTFREYEEYKIRYTYEKMAIYINIINEYLKYLTKSVHIRMAVEEILYPSYFKAKKNYICKKHYHGKFNTDFKVNGYNYAVKGGNQFKRDGIPILQEFIKEYIINIFTHCDRKDTVATIMREQIVKYNQRKYEPEELEKFAKVEKFNQMAKNVSIHSFINRCRAEREQAKLIGNIGLYEAIPNIENSDKFKTIVVDNITVDATGKKIKSLGKMSDRKELLTKAQYLGLKPDMISYLVKLAEYLGSFLYSENLKLDEIKKLTADTIRTWCGYQQITQIKSRWREYSSVYFNNMEALYPGIYQSISNINNIMLLVNGNKFDLSKLSSKYLKNTKLKSAIKRYEKIPNLKIIHRSIFLEANRLNRECSNLIHDNMAAFDTYQSKLNLLFNEFNYGRTTYLAIELNDIEKKVLLQLADYINDYINNDLLCGLYSDKNL